MYMCMFYYKKVSFKVRVHHHKTRLSLNEKGGSWVNFHHLIENLLAKCIQ